MWEAIAARSGPEFVEFERPKRPDSVGEIVHKLGELLPFCSRYPLKLKSVVLYSILRKKSFEQENSSPSLVVSVLVVAVTWMTSADKDPVGSVPERPEDVLRIKPR